MDSSLAGGLAVRVAHEGTATVDYVLAQQMADGGFNCARDRFGARHSLLHSTLSVLEGMLEYVRQGYSYRRVGGLILLDCSPRPATKPCWWSARFSPA